MDSKYFLFNIPTKKSDAAKFLESINFKPTLTEYKKPTPTLPPMGEFKLYESKPIVTDYAKTTLDELSQKVSFTSAPNNYWKDFSTTAKAMVGGGVEALKMVGSVAGAIENVIRLPGDFIQNPNQKLRAIENTVSYQKINELAKGAEKFYKPEETASPVAKYTYMASSMLPRAVGALYGAPGMVINMVSGFTSNIERLKESGHNTNDPTVRARAYWTSAVETATEYVFNLASGLGKFGSAIMGKPAGEAIEFGAKSLYNEFLMTSGAKTMVNQVRFLLSKGAEEGIEEGLSEVGAGIVAKFTTNPDDPLFAGEDGLITPSSVGQAMVAGGLMGFVFSAAGSYASLSNLRDGIDMIKNKPFEQYTEQDYATIGNAMEDTAKDPKAVAEVSEVVSNMFDRAQTEYAKADQFKQGVETEPQVDQIAEEDAIEFADDVVEPVVAKPATVERIEEAKPRVAQPKIKPVKTEETITKMRERPLTDDDTDAWLESDDAKPIRELAEQPEKLLEKVTELAAEFDEAVQVGEKDADGIMRINLQLLAAKRMLDKLSVKLDKGAPKRQALSEHINKMIAEIDVATENNDIARLRLRNILADQDIFHKIYGFEKVAKDVRRDMGYKGSAEKPNTSQYERHRKDLVAMWSEPTHRPSPDEIVAFDQYLRDAYALVGKNEPAPAWLSTMQKLMLEKSSQLGSSLGALSYVAKTIPVRRAENLIKQAEPMFDTTKNKRITKDAEKVAGAVRDSINETILEEVESMTYEIQEEVIQEPEGEPDSLGDRLAKMILDNYQKIDTPKKKDDVKRVLRALYNRYADTMGEKKSQPKDDDLFKFLGDLSLRTDEMKDIWREAQSIVKTQVVPTDLNEFFDIINPLYNKKLLDSAWRKTLKTMNIDLKRMAYHHFFDQNRTLADFGKQLRTNIEQQSGRALSDDEFNYLNKMVTSRLESALHGKRTDIRNSVIRKFTDMPLSQKPKKTYQETMIDRIMEAVVSSQFDDRVTIEIWKDHFGVKDFTQEMKQTIYETMTKIAGMQADGKSDVEINKVYGDLVSKVAKMAPSTNIDKYRAWRRIAMLSNPITIARNPINNFLAMPFYGLSDRINRRAQSLAGVPLDQRDIGEHSVDLKGKSEIARVVQSITHDEMEQDMAKSAKYAIESRIRAEKDIFDNKFLAQWNRGLREIMTGTSKNQFLRMLGDAPVFEMHYRTAVANSLSAQNYSESLSVGEKRVMLETAKQVASATATQRTFRQMNAVSRALVKIQKDSRAGDALVSVIQPFVITPSAILAEGYRFSAINLAVQTGKLIAYRGFKYDIRTKGEIDVEARKNISKNLSQALSGTFGQLVVGMILNSLGFLTGSAPKSEKEKKAWEISGKKAYSIYIPGKGSLSIDWLQPVSVGLIAGAELAQNNLNPSGIPAAMLDSLLKNSIFDTMGRTFGSGDWGGAAMDLLSDAIVQNVPTIGRNIANALDPYERDVYQGTALQILGNRLMQSIPYLSTKIAPKTDVWGRPIPKADLGIGMVGQIVAQLTPFRVGQDRMDSLTKTVMDVYIETSDSGVLPKAVQDKFTVNGNEYELNAEQYSEFQMMVGSESRRLVETVSSKPEFKSMKPEMKAKIIKKMYDSAYTIAKTTVYNRYFSTMVR